MRSQGYEDKNKELEVGRNIKDMWGRIDEAAFEQNTSISAVSKEAGISASAMYSAMRRTKKIGQYTDTLLSCIIALARGLHLDLDYVLIGKSDNKEDTDIKYILCDLSFEDLLILKRIAISIALGVIEGI